VSALEKLIQVQVREPAKIPVVASAAVPEIPPPPPTAETFCLPQKLPVKKTALTLDTRTYYKVIFRFNQIMFIFLIFYKQTKTNDANYLHR
jgi:hypothetical protein